MWRPFVGTGTSCLLCQWWCSQPSQAVTRETMGNQPGSITNHEWTVANLQILLTLPAKKRNSTTSKGREVRLPSSMLCGSRRSGGYKSQGTFTNTQVIGDDIWLNSTKTRNGSSPQSRHAPHVGWMEIRLGNSWLLCGIPGAFRALEEITLFLRPFPWCP